MITPVYTLEEFPKQVTKTIFLLGPTPRSNDVESWRDEMLSELEKQGFDGHVFIPELRSGTFNDQFSQPQIDWEIDACHRADLLLFWIPRELKFMPAFTTNVEFGYWIQSGKCLLGYPPSAEKVRYLKSLGEKHNTAAYENIADIAKESVRRLGEGALRTEQECQVPLTIWNHNTFQSWYQAQRKVNNRLEQFKVRYSHFVNKEFLLSWIADVSIYVDAEGRVKSNEYVFSRQSTVHCLVYYPGQSVLDTHLVLAKEFRSPVMNEEGFVVELVGGSSFKKESKVSSMVSELAEEIGLQVDATRLQHITHRQPAAATAAYTSDLFMYELTLEEWESVQKRSHESYGVAEDSEKTYIELSTVKEMLENGKVDWATIGMCTQALYTAYSNK